MQAGVAVRSKNGFITDDTVVHWRTRKKVVDDDDVGVFVKKRALHGAPEAVERCVAGTPRKAPRARPLSSALRDVVSSSAHPLIMYRTRLKYTSTS